MGSVMWVSGLTLARDLLRVPASGFRGSRGAIGQQPVAPLAVARLAFVQFGIVGFAQRRVRLIVEKGEKRVAPAARDRRHLVQRAAREGDRAAVGGAIFPAPEFGEDQVAALEFPVEVDRDRKAAVLGAGIDVVAVAMEMPA